MPTTLQNDVDFYSMVHEVLRSAQVAEEDGPKRTSDRQPFACRQWIAPLVEGGAPPPGAFVEVTCRDISTGGFSYISPTVPTIEKFAVRLGRNEGWVFLTAGVVHCRPIETDDGPAFLVGCKFLGRVA